MENSTHIKLNCISFVDYLPGGINRRADLKTILVQKIGVSSCQDLIEVYGSDDMVREIQSNSPLLQFFRFKKAAFNSAFLEGQPLSSLITDAIESAGPSSATTTSTFHADVRMHLILNFRTFF